MKKYFVSAALAAAVFATAQKKEIANAYKAVEANDMATAKTQIAAAEVAMNGKTTMLEPEVLEQYYFAKGVMLMRSGQNLEGAEYLAKVGEMGKSKIYSGRDANKNRVYYVGKAEADASGIAGLKEQAYTPTTTAKMVAVVNPIINASNSAALDAYNNKRFEEAGNKFLEVYNLQKAGGQFDGQTLYNAGLSYASANKGDKALDVFNQLISSGYNGVETTYTANNKKTRKVETFDKVTWEAMKMNQDYSDFKTSTSPNIEQQLYETKAALLITENRTDEAITFLDQAAKKFPGNAKLAELQGNAYYKAGKTTEFVASLKNQLERNPNDAVNWFNLGVLQSNDPATASEAENAFKKAVAIDPKMTNAYQNLTFLLMGDDEEAVKAIEAAKKAGNTGNYNKHVQERRTRFTKAIPYAEKWHSLDRENTNAISILKGLYILTNNDVKLQQIKAREAELSQK